MDIQTTVIPDLDFERLVAPYAATNITRPAWPRRGVLMTDFVVTERYESLEESEARYAEYLYGAWVLSCQQNQGNGRVRDLDRAEVIRLAVSRLPKPIVQAAHKRLFGTVEELINGSALELIGHALFNPPFAVGIKGRPLWRDLVQKAELKARDDILLNASLTDLLSELEVA
jgi:hypothetical protein